MKLTHYDNCHIQVWLLAQHPDKPSALSCFNFSNINTHWQLPLIYILVMFIHPDVRPGGDPYLKGFVC